MPEASSIIPHALSIGLIAAGALAYAIPAGSLAADTSLDAPVNPFGINTSPYGEVLAMAMQGPIDTYWHKGMEDTGPATQDPHGDHAGHDYAAHKAPPRPPGVLGFLESLSEAVNRRTNPKPASKAQEFTARRQIENKLRFAYELDPAHYANYNTYHFFLTEPQLGTRPELTPGAAKLAERTINYCLTRTDDPRPALTAAAATENMLDLMFKDRLNPESRFTTGDMRGCLVLLDQCLARYQAIAAHWEATGNWSLLSPQRRSECQERFYFIKKVRESAETTIVRFERNASPNP